ncbi:alcohol oxidase [Hymenopellis radicata]|nr:alcohol oxidase [Hymenopellis radicata]
MANTNEQYDIIFAGAGAAACVTAGRLAATDPSLKILLVEAGRHIKDVEEHVQPARFFYNLVSAKDIFTFHVGKASDAIAGRAPIIPSGKCVGGGSGVNFVMYSRASASDYNDWEHAGNSGWGAKDLIPLANEIETYDDGNPKHGSNGPIKVCAGHKGSLGADFLQVVSKYDKTRGYSDDCHDFDTCDVYAPWFKYIDPKTGHRSDTAHHFIYNQAENANLQVLDQKRVVRVLFEGTRAIGIEYVDETAQDKPDAPTRRAFASKLVVLSAGAFGSPSILERSGIGASEILKKNDIAQLVDLPGVGENYNDHNLVFTSYITDVDDTHDDLFRNNTDGMEPHVKQWHAKGSGLMASNAIDAGIKIRPNSTDLEILGPAFAERWSTFFANAPDKPLMFMGSFAAYAGGLPEKRMGSSLAYFTQYPVSTGRVHIQAGLNPHAPLDIEAGYLDQPADLATLRWSYKHTREIGRRMRCHTGCFLDMHPRFPAGSDAAVAEAQSPVAIDAPNIRYTQEDDEAIDDFHRRTMGSTWHSLGTCAMKPRNQNGVVDSRLNVYGTEGLKVADMSIAPSNVGSNTYNTALIIGAKAAVIIASELGITIKS